MLEPAQLYKMEPVSVESSPVTSGAPGAPGAPRKPKLQRSWEGSCLDSDSDSDSASSLSPIVCRNLNLSWHFHQPEPSESSFRTFSMTMVSPLPLPSPSPLPSPKESIGDCGICYDRLFPRENHVYTQCGHLFCVKCFLRWSDTSLTCPMCRREIVEPGQEQWQDLDHEILDQDVPVPEYTYSYLHMEEDAELVADTSFEMQTDPEHGDRVSNLRTSEIELIQYNRMIVSCVFLRNRFHETLFSGTTWGCRIQHQLIPKTEWLQIWQNLTAYTQRAPAQMFEFVLRRNSQSLGNRRPNEEVNTFGYITSSAAELAEEDGLHLSFAFDVMVTSPTFPLGSHNISEGRIETEVMTFKFEDIRRLYYVTSVETYEV